ncbi:MAG: hypothetical protein QW177_01175 [Candidatus Nitrosotenuis sp.]
MTRWKKDETVFDVNVGYHKTRGYQIYVPRPIMEILGDPDVIDFVVSGKKVEVRSHKET